jgi:PhzF family phenazine biosynthesis protein
VYEFEDDVARLAPDFAALQAASARSIIVSAPGNDCDVVSRFFAPHVGINEDPVTGSAHCCLAPFWAERRGKTEMVAYQASARGGVVRVRLEPGAERVLLGGQAVTVLVGELRTG